MKKKLMFVLRVCAAGMLVVTLAGTVLADTRIEKTLELEPGGRFVLDTKSGAVSVTGTSQSGARIVITSSHDDLESKMSFDFEESPGLVKVTARGTVARKSFFGLFSWGSSTSLKYEIQLPSATDLEIDTGGGSVSVQEIHGDADLETSGGSIRVSGLEGGLEARTSGGSISLDGITGNATVGTSGGSIRASRVDGTLYGRTSGGSVQLEEIKGDLDVGTSGGPIRIAGAGGRVLAKTSGGSVSVSFDPGNDRGGELKTSGGGIRVALDPAMSLDLDAHTSGGRVKAGVPVTIQGTISKSTLKGSMGSGGQLLLLRSSGGSIVIDSI